MNQPVKHLEPSSLSNRAFLKAVLTAVTFLGLSALLLATGFVFFNLEDIETESNLVPTPLKFKGAKFRIALGRGSYKNGSLVLQGMKDGNAVITALSEAFDASDFPILEYAIKGRHPGLKVAFYWAKKDDPRKTYFAMLPWNGDSEMAYRLKENEDWAGQIVEIGLSINGDLRKRTLVLKELSLRPFDVKALLFVVWSEWMTFEGWKQYSINTILGAPKYALLSPVVAAFAWVVLAVFLFLIWCWFCVASKVGGPIRFACSTKRSIFILGIIFIIPWMALDAKWQLNLWRQNNETLRLFSRKTHQEQHLAAEDAFIYKYAKKINNILPDSPQRIFLLKEKPRDYVRLKLMYYLLPHNIYNYGSIPDVRKLRDGDFVLAVAPSTRLEYDSEQQLLWYERQKYRAVRAELIHKEKIASLYKIRSTSFILRRLQVERDWTPVYMGGRLMVEPVCFSALLPFKAAGRSRLEVRWKNGQAYVRLRGSTISRLPLSVLLAETDNEKEKDFSHLQIRSFEVTSNWQTIIFKYPFSSRPGLFLDFQEPAGSAIMEVKNVSPYSFQIRMRGGDSDQAKKKAAFLAITAPDGEGVLSIDNKEYPYIVQSITLTNRWTDIGDGTKQVRLVSSFAESIEDQRAVVDIMILSDQVFAQVVSPMGDNPVSVEWRPLQ